MKQKVAHTTKINKRLQYLCYSLSLGLLAESAGYHPYCSFSYGMSEISQQTTQDDKASLLTTINAPTNGQDDATTSLTTLETSQDATESFLFAAQTPQENQEYIKNILKTLKPSSLHLQNNTNQTETFSLKILQKLTIGPGKKRYINKTVLENPSETEIKVQEVIQTFLLPLNPTEHILIKPEGICQILELTKIGDTAQQSFINPELIEGALHLRFEERYEEQAEGNPLHYENLSKLVITQDFEYQGSLYRKYFNPPQDKYWYEDFLKQPKGVTEEKRAEEVIISLTSYPARMQTTWLAIESLLRQEEKPDRIVLNLFEGEFPGRIVPNFITEQMKRGLEINWVGENTKSYKKLLPTLQKYREAAVVTFDDDIIAPADRLGDLIEGYKEHPNCVISSSSIKLSLNENGSLLPFRAFDFSFNVTTKQTKHNPSNMLIIEGGAGTLYPPNILDDMVFQTETAMRIAETTDDLWFTSMIIKNSQKIYKANNKSKIIFIEENSNCPTALYLGNFRNRAIPMDIAIRRIYEYFNLYEIIGIKPPLMDANVLETFDKNMQQVGKQTLWENAELSIGKRAGGSFVYTLKNVVEAETDLYFSYLYDLSVNNSEKILFIAHEPTPYRMSTEAVLAKHHDFKCIFHNSNSFSHLPNQVKTIGTFIYGNYFNGVPQKLIDNHTFSVSMLASVSFGNWAANPYNLDGDYQFKYQERINVFEKESEIKIPTNFFVSNRGNIPNKYKHRILPNDDKVTNLYTSQFCVVIENIQELDYFSEKIWEPFLNKVVPIYIGCPNIAEYFDIRGILIAKNANEVIQIINNLTPTTYINMQDFIEFNYIKAKEYYEKGNFLSLIQKGLPIAKGLGGNLNFVAPYLSELSLFPHLIDRENKNSINKIMIQECIEVIKCYVN